MSNAERDAQKWIEANRKWQERNLYRAKETGDPYYIDQYGQVIIEKPKAKEKSE